ncbi:MAG: AIR synthase-related protein, partial [Candidatus Rokuibacteriota bacterium]
VGLRIDRSRITVVPEGAELCRAFGLDPLGTIASGALLMTLAPAEAAMVIHALAREGIDSHYIGQVVPPEHGLVLVDGNQQEPLPLFEQDEITKIFRDR